jgi:hypothetical protein
MAIICVATIDASGRLGATATLSSRAHKENIEDLSLISDRLHELRPVSFRHKGVQGARTQYGLIAEEVAEVLPTLVVFDEEGRPKAVRYNLLNSLLLAELQNQRRDITELKRTLEEMRR